MQNSLSPAAYSDRSLEPGVTQIPGEIKGEIKKKTKKKIRQCNVSNLVPRLLSGQTLTFESLARVRSVSCRVRRNVL